MHKSGAVSEDDLRAYIDLLNDKGYLYTTDSASENGVTTLQLGRTSVEEGKIILIDIQFSQLGNTIVRYATGTGTITTDS